MTFYKTSEPQLRTCPVCGTQISLTDPSCPRCGAIFPDAEQLAAQKATEYRFLSALFNRSNPFTMIFIGINVGVFLLMCLAGGISLASVSPGVLLGFGAKQNDLIVNQHQYWRLVTCIFIHIGLVHLLLNNYALWIIGQEIERIYGSARFVVLYLVTGLIGSLGSFFFNAEATSAGASGAIFGLFGAMATFAYRYRKEIPTMLSQEIRRRILPVIAVNLVFGFAVRIVDNSAHIGGLLSGVALALVVPYMRPGEKITPFLWRVLQCGCLILIFVSFVGAFRNYNGPRLAASNLMNRSTSGNGGLVETYFNKMKEGDHLLRLSFEQANNEGQKSPDNLKPAIESVLDGINSVGSVPRINDESDKYRGRLIELLTAQENLLNEFVQSGSKNRAKFADEEQDLFERHNQFITDYSSWLPGFLKERGYQLTDGNGK